MKTTSRNIRLSNLTVWKGNVRKTEGSDTGLAELAASIASVGVINPLTVIERGAMHHVVAGSRRLAALQLLLKTGRIDETFVVPCVVTSEDSAMEVSIAENVVREDMHPADEFEAFLALAKSGASNAEIAARFGYSESMVAKRLRLARVSPRILKAYRAGDLDLECVMAYAVTDDAKRQHAVLKMLSGYRARDPGTIRAALTEHEIDAADKRVRFVTLKAYEKAGGGVRRDLFAEESDASGTYILDASVLEDLVSKKLDKAADALRKEGWKWVEVRPEFGYEDRGAFRQLHEQPVPFAADVADELARLDAEAAALYERDDLSDEDAERISIIEQRIRAIEDSQESFWPDESLAIAGAVVTIGLDGKTDITRGLVTPEDAKALAKAARSQRKAGDGEQDAPQRGSLSGRLHTDLTKQWTAALGAELLERPGIALAALVHCLAGQVFIEGFAGETCLEIAAKTSLPARSVPGDANDAIERERAGWADTVPGDAESLWHWCLAQRPETLLDLLAFCTALTLDAVAPRGRDEAADALAAALSLNMTKWFTPGAANYFSAVSKYQILSALTEAKGATAPAWEKAKKSELAAIAEREIAGTGWLPEPLRVPVGSYTDDTAEAA